MADLCSDSSGFSALARSVSDHKRDEFATQLRNGSKSAHSILMEFGQAGKFVQKIKFREDSFIDEETHNIVYQAQCVIDGIEFAKGEVKTKKQLAKQDAARKALERLLGISPPLEKDSPGQGEAETSSSGAPVMEETSRFKFGATPPAAPSERLTLQKQELVYSRRSLDYELQREEFPVPTSAERGAAPEPEITKSRSFDHNEPPRQDLGQHQAADGPVPEIYKQKIKKKFKELYEGLQLKPLLPSLFAEDVIPQSLFEEWSSAIEGGRSLTAQREFLFEIPKVGMKKFCVFLDVLKREQKWVHDMIVADTGDSGSYGVQESGDQTVPKSVGFSRGVSGSYGVQESGDQTVPKSVGFSRGVSDPGATGRTSLENPPRYEDIVDIEVAPSSKGASSSVLGKNREQYSRSKSSPGVVDVGVVENSPSSVRSSAGSSSTPQPSSLSSSEGDASQSLGRLHTVVEILTEKDIKALKDCVQGASKAAITVLKELQDKYKDKFTVEYEGGDGACYCTVNGIPFEAPSTGRKQTARELAAKYAIDRILETIEISKMAKHLSGQERLIEDFYGNLKEKPPMKIMEEFTKAAKLPLPEYKQRPNPNKETKDGLFTFDCYLNDIKLGSGTEMGKKEAKHAAARDAFRKILRMGGRFPDMSVLADALPDDPPGTSFSGAAAAASSYSSSSGGHQCMEYQQSVSMLPAPSQTAVKPPTSGNTSGDLPCYDVKSTPKGYMLIINNETFTHHDKRAGTEFDEKNLVKTFTDLGFDVSVRNNRKSQEMMKDIQKFARDIRHWNTDSVILSVLSHGESGKVFGSDSIAVQLSDICTEFDAKNCPALRQKPKLFLFQACRGEAWDEGVPLSPDHGAQNSPFENAAGQASNRWNILLADNDQLRIPTLADFLVAFPTVPDHLSWRSSETGSLFIRTVCEVFDQLAKHGHDVAALLTEVNRRVSQLQEAVLVKKDEQKVMRPVAQIPEYKSRLTKRWVLVQASPDSLNS